MKHQNVFKGLATLSGFLCALLLGVEQVASTGDYKNMVDSLLGGVQSSGADQSSFVFESEYDDLKSLISARKELGTRMGEEGCVLLKNNNSLPLHSTSDSPLKVTMLGNRAYTYKSDGVTLRDERLIFYGGYTGSRIFSQTVTTEEGQVRCPITMEDALSHQNIEINPALKDFYSGKAFPKILDGTEGTGTNTSNDGSPFDSSEVNVSLSDCGNYQNYNDAAIVVLGRFSGEGRDYYPGTFGSMDSDCALGLNQDELDLIDTASKISDNVIVLINSAVTMEIEALKNNDKVKSILWIGLPGAYSLDGVAKVINGQVAPSGKLPDSYATHNSYLPSAQNFGVRNPDGSGRFTWSNSQRKDSDDSHYVVLAEDIYTGYYYLETRYNDIVENQGNASCGKGTPNDEWKYEDECSYSFGYGLSYTTFEQEIVPNSFIFDGKNKEISLKVKVKNTGTVAGKDVAELYVSLPYTSYDKNNGIEKSAIQLVGFEKSDIIQPGEYEEVTVYAPLKYFATYDENVIHDGATGGYILEKGNYYFSIGNGAHEAINNVLLKKGHSLSALVVEGTSPKDSSVFVWNIEEEDPLHNYETYFVFNADGVENMYFSKSQADVTISNQLQDADYNYLTKDALGKETITYLSRSDWDNTFPVSYTGLEVVESTMGKYLDNKVYEYSSTGNLPSYVQFGVDHSEEEDDETGEPLENTDIASYKGVAYEDESWDYLLQQITFDEAWLFAPYGGSSCKKFESVNAPEAFQADGPNGNLTNTYGKLSPDSGYLGVSKSDPNAGNYSNDMPCAPMIAATFNKKIAHEQGVIMGEDNLWSRSPIMWAPGMNLHRSPFNSRNHEYYSEDPMLTNYIGQEVVEGGLEKGSILAAKHFAFNTQESNREGLIQFFNEQTGREMELRGFQSLSEDIDYVNNRGNHISSLGIMSSFSRVGVCGVNGHTGLMKNILRGEWGFKGLISTDMVVGTNFFNPQDAVINNVTFMATTGADGLMASEAWAPYSRDKAFSDPRMKLALYENMHYYMYSLANSMGLNGLVSGQKIAGATLSWWQSAFIGTSIGFGVLATGLIGYAIIKSIIDKKKEDEILSGGDK